MPGKFTGRDSLALVQAHQQVPKFVVCCCSFLECADCPICQAGSVRDAPPTPQLTQQLGDTLKCQMRAARSYL